MSRLSQSLSRPHVRKQPVDDRGVLSAQPVVKFVHLGELFLSGLLQQEHLPGLNMAGRVETWWVLSMSTAASAGMSILTVN